MDVSEALHARTSIRAYLPDPVSESQVRHILDEARWAPSGGNLQPWKVIAVAGAARQAVTDLASRVLAENPAGETEDRPVYPPNLWEPYRTRRYALGEDMYALLGIPREDKAGRLSRFAANFEFFGAPVGLFFALDGRMGINQWAHVGMLMQSIALVATEVGLATCMQESWSAVHRSLAKHFQLPEHDVIYCGMALGHADPNHPVNRLRSTRVEVDEFATFQGF
ncbi:MAG: nitroreductase [Myxococcales bacterium]|nr:nitroreductase [Myxococcales bacterium]